MLLSSRWLLPDNEVEEKSLLTLMDMFCHWKRCCCLKPLKIGGCLLWQQSLACIRVPSFKTWSPPFCLQVGFDLEHLYILQTITIILLRRRKWRRKKVKEKFLFTVQQTLVLSYNFLVLLITQPETQWTRRSKSLQLNSGYNWWHVRRKDLKKTCILFCLT